MAQSGPRTTSGAAHASVPIVVVALVLRLVLFAAFQALIALLLAATGASRPWAESAAWWPFAAAATGVVTFGFLAGGRGSRHSPSTSLDRPVRPGVGRDILLTLAVTVVGGALAVGGTIALAPVFFADPRVADAMLFQPLPAVGGRPGGHRLPDHRGPHRAAPVLRIRAAPGREP